MLQEIAWGLLFAGLLFVGQWVAASVWAWHNRRRVRLHRTAVLLVCSYMLLLRARRLDDLILRTERDLRKETEKQP